MIDRAGARRASTISLPVDALELLIEGVELDVLGAEYETFDELVRYCRLRRRLGRSPVPGDLQRRRRNRRGLRRWRTISAWRCS